MDFIESPSQDGRQAIVLKGEWTVANAAAIESALSGQAAKPAARAQVDASCIKKLDTVGAWLIRKHFPESEVCHLSGAERAAFLEAYGRAHPGRLRAPHREARTRSLTVTVPDLGDDKKNRALEQLIVDLAAQLARYAESVG